MSYELEVLDKLRGGKRKDFRIGKHAGNVGGHPLGICNQAQHFFVCTQLLQSHMIVTYNISSTLCDQDSNGKSSRSKAAWKNCDAGSPELGCQLTSRTSISDFNTSNSKRSIEQSSIRS